MSGTGSILLMDDAIRAVIADMLEYLGHRVVSFPSGEEALDAYKKAHESGAPFDAVVTDLTVPGRMGGKELIRELLAFDPQVKAIVSSGYSDDPIISDYQGYGFSGVLVKPYTDEDLAKVIGAVIYERRQAPLGGV
jgi:CheY-like chemotaxis protein